MKPEEIDKLFKNRLGNASPTPPADLWNRLQTKIEAEAPLQIKPDEEKKSFMWIHSSVAAALALLLTVGVVFYNIKSTPEVSQTIASNENPLTKEIPVEVIPERTAQVEKESISQATEVAPTASTNLESDIKTTSVIREKSKVAKQTKMASVIKSEKQVVQNTLAKSDTKTNISSEQTEVDLKTEPNTLLASNTSNTNMNAQPVEITIKRSASTFTTAEVITDQQTNALDKKAGLAKNIFKQVRNLANGEQVELADLGIRADKIAFEAQVGRQKFSKVINL